MLFKVSIDDLLAFTRQLTYLVKMKFPLDEGLKHLKGEFASKKMKEVIEDVEKGVEKGESFSRSLSFYKNVFPPLYQKMIELGESTDTLEKNLDQLTSYMEFNRRLTREINAALAYPIALFTFLMLELLLIFSYVIPNITSLFEGMNISLPLTTRVLMNFIHIYREYHLFWIFILFLIIVNMWGSIPGLLVDRIRLFMPVIGRFYRWLSYAQFARSMALLLSSGVTLTDALEYAKKAIDNTIAREHISNIKEKVAGGTSLSQAIAETNYFTPTFSWMVSCGEAREEVPDIMMEIADFYDKEVQFSTSRVMRWLEPIALIVLGQMVGFLVISVFLPLYQFIRTLH